MSVRPRKLAAVAAAVAVLAGAGGVAAQFTTSTTSAPQSIGTGTVALALDNVAPTVWTDPIGNLAAGDSVERFVDVRNSGTLKLSGLTLAQTNTLGDLLTAPSDVSVKLQGCAVAWNSATGVCPSGAIDVLSSSSVAAWGNGTKALSTFEDFGAGEVRHVKITTTLASTAPNAAQGKNGTITYTFAGVQRAAGDTGTTPPLPSGPLSAPSAATASSATFAFSDPTAGKATYTVSWGETGNSAVAPQTAVLPKGATSYTISGLNPGTSYDVALTAQLGVQKTVSTTSYAAPVAAPSAVSASGTTTSATNLSWTDTSGGKASYELTYTTGAGVATKVSIAAGKTSYALTGLSQDTAYTLSLVAKVNGVSSTAATTSVRTAKAVNLVRTSVPGAAGYAVPNGSSATATSNWTPASGAIDNNAGSNWNPYNAGNQTLTVNFPSATPVTSIGVLFYGGAQTINTTIRGKQADGTWTQIGSQGVYMPGYSDVYNTINVTDGNYTALEVTFNNGLPYSNMWHLTELTLNPVGYTP